MDKHYQCLKTCTYFKEFGRKVFGRKIMKNSCRRIFPELTGEQPTTLRYFTDQVAGDVVKGVCWLLKKCIWTRELSKARGHWT